MANPKIGVMFGPYISFDFLVGVYDVEHSPGGKEGIDVARKIDWEANAAGTLEYRTSKIGIGTGPRIIVIPRR